MKSVATLIAAAAAAAVVAGAGAGGAVPPSALRGGGGDDVSSTATGAGGKEYSPDPNSVKVRSAEKKRRERESWCHLVMCDSFPTGPTTAQS